MCADGRAWHSAAMCGTAGKIHYGDDQGTFADVSEWEVNTYKPPDPPKPQRVVPGGPNRRQRRAEASRIRRMSKSRLTKTRGQAQ